jgi:hypothetical protein
MEPHKKLIWYRDIKLLAGIILVIISFVLGFFSKIVIFAAPFVEPIIWWTGLSVYALSWIMLFFGAFLIGWESVKLMQQRINYHVIHATRKTYHYTTHYPKKGIHHAMTLHKKFKERHKHRKVELIK